MSLRNAWNATFNAVARTANTVSSTMESAEKALENVNHYVEDHTKANKLLITEAAKMRATKGMRAHTEELNADPELQAIYDQISENW